MLEPWITPSLFTSGGPVDEYDLCASLGSNCFNVLSNHWNTWITQDDFNQIAGYGLNHVRIPIGYWAINPLAGDPYVSGQLDVLDKAIEWARDAGLKVLLDLHGAPGSQNGFDNSGKYGAVDWQTDANVQQTLVALNKLSARYANALDVVTAIEILNEPLGPDLNMDAVKQFYWDGFGNIRESQTQSAVVIHDAFQDPVSYWNGFMNSQSPANNIILDHHDYQVFSTGELGRTSAQHIATACAIGANLAQSDKWLVVGEWTGAQTGKSRLSLLRDMILIPYRLCQVVEWSRQRRSLRWNVRRWCRNWKLPGKVDGYRSRYASNRQDESPHVCGGSDGCF